jgi:hypothetical protein
LKRLVHNSSHWRATFAHVCTYIPSFTVYISSVKLELFARNLVESATGIFSFTSLSVFSSDKRIVMSGWITLNSGLKDKRDSGNSNNISTTAGW